MRARFSQQQNCGAWLEVRGAVRGLNQAVASLHLQKQPDGQVKQLATGPQVVLESLLERDVGGGREPMQLLQLLSEAVQRLGFCGQVCFCLSQQVGKFFRGVVEETSGILNRHRPATLK